MLRERFHARIDENWKLARNAFARPKEERVRRDASADIGDANGSEVRDPGAGSITEVDQPAGRGQIRIGFARIPRTGTG